MSSKKSSYYAISKGKECNKIVLSWDECKNMVHGFKGAIYKKFSSREEAQLYLEQNKNTQVSQQNTSDTIINKRKSNPNTKTIIIYTDGSLVRRQKEIYAGYGIFIPSKNIEISEILEGTKTNNRAELTAIIRSIKMFKIDEDVCIHIYTDSQYSMGIFGETGIKYKQKNYMKNTTTEVPNADLVKIAVELADLYILKFTHINSHTSLDDIHSRGNDRADTLAVRGAVNDYTNRCPRLGDSILTFGKYKNNYLKDIPTSYLSWILTSRSFEELCVKNEDRRLEKEIVMKYMDTLTS